MNKRKEKQKYRIIWSVSNTINKEIKKNNKTSNRNNKKRYNKNNEIREM